MRPFLSLKTLLRTPFKTLLTFLLITAASFALFSRVADYAITQREMERTTVYYRGVAALDNGVQNTATFLASYLPGSSRESYERNEKIPPTALTKEQIHAFSTLPGVSSTDTRYMTSGIIDGLKRVVRYGPYIVKYDYTDRFVLEGTFTGITVGKFGTEKINKINLADCNPLAGGIPIGKGRNASVVAFAHTGGEGITRGDMHLFYYIKDNLYNQSFTDGLAKGDRCVIIGRWDPRYFIDSDFMSLFIGDQDTVDYCDSFQSLKGKPENWLETNEFKKVREIVDITNRDLKTFDMVYTSDMLSIPRFNEGKMVMQEGRALTKADSDVCVANYSFLKLNGLKIGDKLKVQLCDKLFNQHSGMGATAVIPERYGKPVRTADLTIVGACTDTDTQGERDGLEWWSYSPNTIFVPLSLLPVKPPDSYEIKPGEFSVVIDDANRMEEFLETAKPLAKKMGIELRFSDKGWLKVKDSISTSQAASLITTGLYIGAAAVALLLATYLYIGRQKRTYAIMRALGTPRDKARNALLLPFAALTLLGVSAGGAAGMIYAFKTVSSALKQLASVIEKYVPDSSLPAGAMLLCLLGEAAFLILLSILFMGRLAKTPPLVLLQGDATRVRPKKAAVRALEQAATPLPKFVLSFPIGQTAPVRGNYGGARHTIRYILRHMVRAGWKTIIGMLLAAFLAGAVGLLALTQLSYRELFDKITVTGTLSNYSSDAVMDAEHSTLMKNFYYSGGYQVICNGVRSLSGNSLALTNDINRYVQTKTSIKYTIAYAKGFDSSLFKGNDALCLLGGNVARQYGIKPGDTITLLSWERARILSLMYKEDKEISSQIEQSSLELKVAGVITSGDPRISTGVFAPLSKTVERISTYVEYPFPVESGKFVLVNKENPFVLRGYLEKLKKSDSKYMEAVSYKLDTTELDNTKRMRDMLALLFPIAAAAAILIGLTAPVLILMQSTKEAAIMRILGTTKMHTRCMLAIEQISLCVFGLAIASLGLVVYNAGLFERSTGTLALCGALYLLGCVCATIFAAVSVTRRKVLELLQVKE